MPKSVEAFRAIRKSQLAHVFNYDLMQSMAGGTFRNAMALTRGNQTFGDFFSSFHDNGYHVTYMDDLCWTYMFHDRVIGIPRLFGMQHPDTYKKNMTKAWGDLNKLLFEKGVDQMGATLANCNSITGPYDLFKTYGKHARCYNGKFHTDYLFEYMEVLQTQLHSAKRPYFNYLDLNICHEPSGLRCQSLDTALASFIMHTSKQPNTITIMFGDHGVKYGQIPACTPEGYFEAGNPVCFILASKDLNLPKDQLQALSLNQNRLIDIIDIRQTVNTLSGVKDGRYSRIEEGYDNHPNGLLHPINPKRTCKTLGIKLESKCICGGTNSISKTSNGTRVALLAEYALGELNNIIQEQFISLNRNHFSGFGSCQRLVGKRIDNVYENVIGVSMDYIYRKL